LITELEQQFLIEKIDVGGIDFSVWKIFCKALSNPKTLETVNYSDLNLKFKVVAKGQPLVNEVKKVGVIIDRS